MQNSRDVLSNACLAHCSLSTKSAFEIRSCDTVPMGGQLTLHRLRSFSKFEGVLAQVSKEVNSNILLYTDADIEVPPISEIDSVDQQLFAFPKQEVNRRKMDYLQAPTFLIPLN